MNPLFHLLGGGVLLYFGAQSTPEVIVSVQAAMAGYPAVAIGNVIGSNIANIGLILGTAVLIAPARVDGTLRSRELPVLLAATALVPAALSDGAVSRVEGSVLLACGFLYTAWMIRAARASAEVAAAKAETVVEREVADLAGGPKARGAGAAALGGNVAAPLREMARDLVALGVMTALAATLIRRNRTITRQEGAVATGLYVAFIATSIAAG